MSLLTAVLIGLLIWLLVLAALIVVVALGSRRRRGHDVADREMELSMADDRRSGGDRRIGLPDTRPVRIERRRGPDRRGSGVTA